MIGDLINMVYRQEGTKHYFNVSPYFNAEYDFQDDGFTGAGTFGNGNGVITYSEKAEWDDSSFSYEINQSGQAKSSPTADMYPKHLLEDSFESNLVISGNFDGLRYKQTGNINGEEFLANYGLSFKGFTQQSKKTSVSLQITRENNVSDDVDDFWKSWMAPNGETQIDVKATVKNACMVDANPLNKHCTAKLEITGNDNGNDFGKNVAKYSVLAKKAQLMVKHNDEQVFYLSFNGIDTWEVLAIKYKLMDGPITLFLQVVGPAGAEAVGAAFMQFMEPFSRFFSGLVDPDDFA